MTHLPAIRVHKAAKKAPVPVKPVPTKDTGFQGALTVAFDTAFADFQTTDEWFSFNFPYGNTTLYFQGIVYSNGTESRAVYEGNDLPKPKKIANPEKAALVSARPLFGIEPAPTKGAPIRVSQTLVYSGSRWIRQQFRGLD